jgi:hypothetical protein
VEKTAKKFRSFAEAEKADRDFYKKLTGDERLRILVEQTLGQSARGLWPTSIR